eukprot:5015283-Pleurochrysis_carterae.AAC.1
MALIASVATFCESVRGFLRVVLESDFFSATFHLADKKAKDDAAQRALEFLHAIPKFLSARPCLHVRHVFGVSDPMANAYIVVAS